MCFWQAAAHRLVWHHLLYFIRCVLGYLVCIPFSLPSKRWVMQEALLRRQTSMQNVWKLFIPSLSHLMSKVSIKSKLCVRLALGSQLLLKQIETNISSTPAPPIPLTAMPIKSKAKESKKFMCFSAISPTKSQLNLSPPLSLGGFYLFVVRRSSLGPSLLFFLFCYSRM